MNLAKLLGSNDLPFFIDNLPCINDDLPLLKVIIHSVPTLRTTYRYSYMLHTYCY